jgi:hypothetical protein
MRQDRTRSYKITGPSWEVWEIDDEQLMKETLGVKAAAGGIRWLLSDVVEHQFGRIYMLIMRMF